MSTVHHLKFYTSHCQFYIHDKGSAGDTGSEFFWSDEAFEDRLAVGKGILGIGVERWGFINVDIELLDAENSFINIDDYDHIVEAGIEIKSGAIQILDCPTSEIQLKMEVNPGLHKVRIYSMNLSSVNDDEEEGEDVYRVEIWADNHMTRKVLKRYKRN